MGHDAAKAEEEREGAVAAASCQSTRLSLDYICN